METTAGVMGAKRGQWRAIKDLSRAALDGSKWLWSQMKDSTWALRWASQLNGLEVLWAYSAEHQGWRAWWAIGCRHLQDHPQSLTYTTKRSYQGSVLLFHLILYNCPATFVITKFRFTLDAMVLTLTTHQIEVIVCSYAWYLDLYIHTYICTYVHVCVCVRLRACVHIKCIKGSTLSTHGWQLNHHPPLNYYWV